MNQNEFTTEDSLTLIHIEERESKTTNDVERLNLVTLGHQSNFGP